LPPCSSSPWWCCTEAAAAGAAATDLAGTSRLNGSAAPPVEAAPGCGGLCERHHGRPRPAGRTIQPRTRVAPPPGWDAWARRKSGLVRGPDRTAPTARSARRGRSRGPSTADHPVDRVADGTRSLTPSRASLHTFVDVLVLGLILDARYLRLPVPPLVFARLLHVVPGYLTCLPVIERDKATDDQTKGQQHQDGEPKM